MQVGSGGVGVSTHAGCCGGFGLRAVGRRGVRVEVAVEGREGVVGGHAATAIWGLGVFFEGGGVLILGSIGNCTQDPLALLNL